MIRDKVLRPREPVPGELVLTLEPLPAPATEPNPCARVLGYGPDGAKCKTCALLKAYRYQRTYYKCALRPNTSSAATDHRVNWRACARYEEVDHA